MKNEATKLIYKTAAWTLLIAFAVTCYGMALFGQIFPKPMSDLTAFLGARNASAMYTERYYKKNPTNKNLYLVVDSYIGAENWNKVIKYAPRLFNHDGYNDVVLEVNQIKAQYVNSDEEYALLCNEDNRLRCQYTLALLQTGKLSAALSFFRTTISKTDLSAPSYIFFIIRDSDIGSGSAESIIVEYIDYVTRFRIALENSDLEGRDRLVAQYFLDNLKIV